MSKRTFGHSNRYYRYAFPEAWWLSKTRGTDLAVVNYSYWSWLPCRCPKVVVLLDRNARDYYNRFLKADMILDKLRDAYLAVAEQGRFHSGHDSISS